MSLNNIEAYLIRSTITHYCCHYSYRAPYTHSANCVAFKNKRSRKLQESSNMFGASLWGHWRGKKSRRHDNMRLSCSILYIPFDCNGSKQSLNGRPVTRPGPVRILHVTIQLSSLQTRNNINIVLHILIVLSFVVVYILEE